MTSTTWKTAPIPFLDLGPVHDQRYADADFHCDEHGRLSSFFGRSVPVHRHDRFFQIHCIFNGQVHLYLDDQQYRLPGPVCFFTPPGVPHAFVTDADSEGITLTIRQQRVWSLFHDEAEFSVALGHPLCVALAPHQMHEQDAGHTLQRLFHQAQAEFHASHPGRDGNLMALLRLIIASLLRLGTAAPARRPVAPTELQLFHRFNQLLVAHCVDNWPLQRYADTLGLTTARLNLICRRLADMSSKQIIAERQLQEAKRLLLHSNQSVSQICFALGFQDPAYFSRFFSLRTGMPPVRFRQLGATPGALRKVQA
ncbi:4-hydroxyphenylacetate catabolism regulatory protein HpaA [Kerstersia gyiorum]|uniref:4-hydroxyphenylacetate catabolism regulatory protein HpaA n=1 Tax=Kerstersia gyiorum TaxID=206506 RepID=UPI00209DE53D|nr:4-hydroxyphenylacetate catabolism regulatory protein HpaA [Kerstersia gyiorum]MCP1677805.1 AraC family 4-hydroxyphenylacetate 3-monooxygenase operon regulatory protein [Kerstersia gyiorum]MCP1710881.1 AraC family 4-hydroxyphenylacetate 3-monooxygenase operon regulatory protein [Kerstersia gyiorum]MCP1822304.1 AraC family 4-hydroxyphenylacetate 3-monooxygenase operon regulatory protein [Kerstersia gyiorum]MCP1825728.1 AraC family 4-hydroxyphenylacetate 3-monooxygenase operon regulatory protei